ncbi:protein mono-ADP-ribosyltransferase PARP12-like [Lissotriton helveticus]
MNFSCEGATGGPFSSSVRYDVNFARLSSSYQVPRLSTATSLTQPLDHQMRTEWVWLWKNEHGQWIEYGQHGGKEKAAITSADLEKIYHTDKKAVVPFQAGGQQYQIHFEDMIQKNCIYGTKKDVCRRSRFLSNEEIDELKLSSGRRDIDFEGMSYFYQVPWLSTATSLTQLLNHQMTTEWVWLWKNEHGQWIEYGQHGGMEKAAITSADLEKIYLTDKKAVIPFQAGDQQYQIHFKDKIQKNLNYGTEREVCRRVRFVSKENIDKLKPRSKGTANQPTFPTKGIPGNWDSTAVPDVGYKLVEVSKHSMEFKEIEKSFKKTMPQHTISKVQRIQNITLWNFYQMQKDTMKKQNSKDVLEKQLFHGTKPIYLDGICHHNFDWRVCGLNGTVYGKGSYFARDASYSDDYCDSNSSSKSMFLARVLVGDFVRGKSSYTRPPQRPYTQGTFYDSCVDKDPDPSIFVIFEKLQIYPEYIIEYSKNYQSYPQIFT